jgi:hypothetical protein
MTGPAGDPLADESVTDEDAAPDDLVEGADDLPEDVPNDDLGVGEPADDGAAAIDDNSDIPVQGSPADDLIHDEDEGT